jgi:subtilisin-like proprotein convertase family protein
MTVHHWGESPIGRWTLRIESRLPTNENIVLSAIKHDVGELKYFGLRLFGSYRIDDNNANQASTGTAFAPTADEIETIYRKELDTRRSPQVIAKRHYQDLIKQTQLETTETDDKKEYRSLFELFQRQFDF